MRTFERVAGLFSLLVGAISLWFVYASLARSSFVIPSNRGTPGYSASLDSDPVIFWATIAIKAMTGTVFAVIGLFLLVRKPRGPRT